MRWRAGLSSGVRGAVRGAVLFSCLGTGCYNAITDAVVDKETDPGGTLAVQIAGGPPGSLPALASGSPLSISGQTSSLVVALTCRADDAGVDAATALATAGAQLTLHVAMQNGNQLQVHTGGKSCIADAGTITLIANSDGTLSGSFDTTGTVTDSGAPVTLTGTLSEIPQAH